MYKRMTTQHKWKFWLSSTKQHVVRCQCTENSRELLQGKVLQVRWGQTVHLRPGWVMVPYCSVDIWGLDEQCLTTQCWVLTGFYPEWQQSVESRYISAQHLQAAGESAAWLAPPVDPACLLGLRIKADKLSPVTSINTHKENHSIAETEKEGRLGLFAWGSHGCSHLSPLLPSICWLARTRRWIDQDVDCCDCLASAKVQFFQDFRLSVEIVTSKIVLGMGFLHPKEKLFISFHLSFWPETSTFFYSFIELRGSQVFIWPKRSRLSYIMEFYQTQDKTRRDKRF